MKKIFSILTIAAAALAASCTQVEEDFSTVKEGEEVTVSFTAGLPEIATRAYSDGTTATTLRWAVYPSGETSETKTVLIDGEETFENLEAVVNTELVVGKTYDILFWAADATNQAYDLSLETQSMTVDYNKLTANNESNDAFFAFRKEIKVNGVINETVTLTRPFAQINIGTDDYAKAKERNLLVGKTGMKAELHNVLNLATGEVSGSDEFTIQAGAIPEITFNEDGTVTGSESFPVKGYEYLEMNYILMGVDKDLIDLEFYVYEAGTDAVMNPSITVANVPVQRNYRTNIYGSILTDPTNFKVMINKDYIDEDKDGAYDDYNVKVADVQTVDEISDAIEAGATNVNVQEAPAENTTVMLPAVSADKAGKEIAITLPETDKKITFSYASEKPEDGKENFAYVNISAESADDVEINLRDSHVTLNGKNYGTVTAFVSPTTLVVAEGVNVDSLIIKEGNVEVYGTVGTISLADGCEVKAYAVKTDEDMAKAISYKAANIVISSAEGLKVLANTTNAGTSFSKMSITLSNDIDLAGAEWTPIGMSGKAFSGIFDGNGKTVSNLKISGNNSNVGLFGYTTNGEVKNLTVNNAEVSGRLAVGVVAGVPYTSKYTNIKVTGLVKVDGMAYVGTVGGRNVYANWTDVTVDVAHGSYVKANSVEDGTEYRTYVGGVAGFIGEGKITMKNIASNIDVTGSSFDVGGLFGNAHYGNSFINCSCSGDVEVTNETDEIGGIAGVWINSKSGDVTFTGCSFTGALKAVEGVDLSDNTIVGAKYNPESTDGNLTIDGYRILDGVAYNDVDYLISNAKGLRWFAEQVNNKTTFQNKNVKLTADIDLAEQDWTPINSWDGILNGTTIDGQGYTISNMSVNGGSSCGFISNNASSVTVRNLTFDNAVVKANEGNGTYAGVVMGKSYSSVTLENVHVKNSIVVNNWQCGGLVGFAETNAPAFVGCSISDSFVGGSNATAGAFFGLGGVDITCTRCDAANISLYTDMEAGFVGYLYGKTFTAIDCTSTDVVVVSEYPEGI